MEFFTRFNRPPSPSVWFDNQSLCHAEFKRECDINFIIERYTKTGSWSGDLTHSPRQPFYADLTSFDPSDLSAAVEKIRAADSAFAALPAKVRARFANSPVQLFAFLSDASNRAEAEALGLINSKAVSTAAPVPAEKPVSEGVAEA